MVARKITKEEESVKIFFNIKNQEYTYLDSLIIFVTFLNMVIFTISCLFCDGTCFLSCEEGISLANNFGQKAFEESAFSQVTKFDFDSYICRARKFDESQIGQENQVKRKVPRKRVLIT